MERRALVWPCWMGSDSTQASGKTAIRQLISYALIGLLTNLVGYALYLMLTYIWGSPKLTMTALYAVGAVIGFLANRRFTFRHEGRIDIAGFRYILAHLLGYLLNLSLLVVFVDWMGFAHQIVQAVAIIVVALFLFVLSRFFVFAPKLAENEAMRS